MTKTSRTVGVLLGGLALLLTGCGSKSDSSSGDGSAGSSSASSSPASPTTHTSPSSSSSSPAGPTPCRTSGLKVSLGPGEGAAGSTFLPLMIKNVSTQACRTGGFGGVSLVTGPQGKPIGAPADRTEKGSARPIVLKPGQVATATLQVTNAGNYSAAKCMPKHAAGFRVYPPNETHSAFVAHGSPACASATVHLLTLRPYRAG